MDHLYQGKCPDAINGPDARDPDCKICQLLDTPAPLTHHRTQLTDLPRPPMITPDLDHLAALDVAATPGPWLLITRTWTSKTDGHSWSACGIEQDEAVYGLDTETISYANVTGQIGPKDAAAMVALRNAAPALITTARSYEALLAAVGRVCEAQGVNQEDTALAKLSALYESLTGRAGKGAEPPLANRISPDRDDGPYRERWG